MGLSSRKVLEIAITVSEKKSILEEIQKYIEKVKSQKSKIKSEDIKPLVIFTPNPEIINHAQKDHIFKQIVNSAQINLPDGAGVEWGIKKLYGLNVSKFSGVDLMGDLCSLSAKEGLIIGLIGGRHGVALEALECLQKEYPGLKGWAIDGPDIEIQNSKCKIQNQVRFGQNYNLKLEIIDRIIKEKTAILFVALGCPKQEYFIEELKVESEKLKIHHPLVLMAVGGSFDYLSGRITRAPFWMREKGLEWLYRLIREPWRLFRQIKGSTFFLRVLVRQLQIQLHLI